MTIIFAGGVFVEDLNINVIKGFGIKHRYITKERATYVCHTDAGKKIIRRVNLEPKHILFQHEVKRHLYKNGFQNLDMYITSLQNRPYFEWNNERYVMTEPISGKSVDFQKKDDFRKVIIGVANFHKISDNTPLAENSNIYKNDNLKEVFERKIHDLANIKKKLRKTKNLSDFDVIFIKNYDYYMNLMIHAKELLENSAYEHLTSEAKLKNSICHNFLKEENLFFDAKGELILSNFSEASIDSCIIDLAELIKRYVKVLPEDHLNLNEILELYTSVHSLNSAELQALQPLLLFPNKFLKICSQYYSKKRSWVPSALNSRMQVLISQKNITEKFLSLHTSL